MLCAHEARGNPVLSHYTQNSSWKKKSISGGSYQDITKATTPFDFEGS